MAVNLDALNRFLEYPKVEFSGFCPSQNSLELNGILYAYGELGELVATEKIVLDHADIMLIASREMEGLVKFARDRLNEAKARLAEKMKEEVPVC